MPTSDLRLSVVIPFHKNLGQLEECLRALSPLPHWADLTVAADGARESCHALVSSFGGRVVEIPAGPKGPACARNLAASQTSGDVLVFIDTDVVAARDALSRFRDILTERSDVAAVFGAYDEHPRDTGFCSQYRNLSHSYFHQSSRKEAQTFWAGLGAIRRETFEEVSGFDERFERPCVEDIELGYRVTAKGHKVLLEPSIRGCHLKRWTVRSSIMSDLRDRGIPWTQLLLMFRRFDNDLNLQTKQRAAVLLSYMLLASPLLAAVAGTVWLAAAAALLLALIMINRHYYAFFLRRRGLWFSARVFPLHVMHHLCNGLSFVAGCTLFYMTNRMGIVLPGALRLSRSS